MSEELKPCPFCGARAENYGNTAVGGRPRWEVSCALFCVTIWRGTKKEAIEHWNKRVDEHALTTQRLGEANEKINKLHAVDVRATHLAELQAELDTANERVKEYEKLEEAIGVLENRFMHFAGRIKDKKIIEILKQDMFGLLKDLRNLVSVKEALRALKGEDGG